MSLPDSRVLTLLRPPLTVLALSLSLGGLPAAAQTLTAPLVVTAPDLRGAASVTVQPGDTAFSLARRAGLEQHEMRLLAGADALASLAGHRRQQVWEAAALQRPPALLRAAPVDEDWLDLPPAPEGEEIVFDYHATGLTLRRHPLALLRERLAERHMLTAEQLHRLPGGRRVATCGIVTLRQQPSTANGTIFVSLEDETGVVQVIVWKGLRDEQRAELLGARLLGVHGTWQREGKVCNLIAHRLSDWTPLLGRLADAQRSRDFR